ncbi:MAG: SDR family NAD(P)-dependent oxidoreductase [Arcticibacter sp.]
MKDNLIWVVGASSGLGRQLVEKLASKGYSLVLSARNARDLDSLSKHVEIVYNVNAQIFPFDLYSIQISVDSDLLVNDFIKKFGMPKMCYMISGAIDDSDNNLSVSFCLPQLIKINFLAPALILTDLIRQKKDNESLDLVVASSVAAIRPRSKNLAYGIAKKSLEQFCFGMLHSQSDSGVKIQIVRFGYMDTNLSYGHKLPFPAANVSKVANQLVNLVGKPSGLYYLPRFWWVISIILQNIPFYIFKKIKS